MVKIIIEDIKINKRNGQIALKKDIPTRAVEPHHNNFIKKVDKEENILKVEKKIEPQNNFKDEEEKELKENEDRINQYLKYKASSNQRLQSTPQVKTKPRLISKITTVIFLLCILVGGIYWGGDIFQKANITITSKHEFINYKNKSFLASKNKEDNSIDFEIMITSNKKPKNIILTDSKEVSLKAVGSIILYNEFSTSPIKIASGSFISDENGRAYKTNSAISIPGYKIENEKIVPGQIVVDITSFLAGDAYNGSPTDFYITSFKGTTKYSKVYGKLKNPLIGGAQGLVYILNDSNKSNLDNIAVSSFKTDLLEQVKAMVPTGYKLYTGASTFTYKIGENIYSKTPEAEIEIEGVLSVVLLKEKSLIDTMVKISLPNTGEDELKEIKILDLDKLSFSFVNKDQLITKDIISVPFILSGKAEAVWYPDLELLKTKLVGIRKSEVLPIFKQDKGISSAIVKIFPPWQRYIPSDISNINMISR